MCIFLDFDRCEIDKYNIRAGPVTIQMSQFHSILICKILILDLIQWIMVTGLIKKRQKKNVFVVFDPCILVF